MGRQNHSIRTGNRSVERLSVWRRVGQSQCLFSFGPLGELWWGFVGWESHHQVSHQPRTAAKCWLCLSVQASVQLGSIPYNFLKKNPKHLGRGMCVHSYAGGEAGSALPVRPQSSHLAQSHLSTHSHPVPAGLGLARWLTGLVAMGPPLLLAKCAAGQRNFAFASGKPISG